jgi:hypothetical protein
MKRPHWLLVVIGVGIVGLAAGYWLGLRQGGESGTFSDALTASASVWYLEGSQDAKITVCILEAESRIDGALIANHTLEEQPWFRILPPMWGSKLGVARRESLVRLANYRKEHPSPLTPEALDALIAEVPESERERLSTIDPSLRQSVMKTQETIADMVSRYASKSPEGK